MNDATAAGMLLSTADRLEIHELAARYGTTIDDRDWPALEQVFCRDAVYELRGFGPTDRQVVGSAEIRRMMEDTQDHPVAHHVTNVIVTVEGSEVRMRSKVIGSGPRGPRRLRRLRRRAAARGRCLADRQADRHPAPARSSMSQYAVL